MTDNDPPNRFSRHEFKRAALLAVATASDVRRIRVDDEVFRKLRKTTVANSDTPEHILEALTLIMREIAANTTTRRVRYSDVASIIRARLTAADESAEVVDPGTSDESEVEWVADGDLHEEPTFQVRRILDRIRRDGVTYYVVDWEPTLEPRSNIPLNLIAAFERERRALVQRTFIDDQAVEARR